MKRTLKDEEGENTGRSKDEKLEAGVGGTLLVGSERQRSF